MASTINDRSKLSMIRKNPCLKTELLKNLYEQRAETGDIKFIIEAQEIHAHRCVLAALSPKYKAQFYGAMSEKDVIHISGTSYDAFTEFLQFFYADEVTLSIRNIEDVLNLAKQSLVDDLITECINFLCDAVGLDKLLWFYRLAMQYEIESLENVCSTYITGNVLAVFKTSDFLSCENDMLCHILTLSSSLNCDFIDLFDGCILWARAKCQQNEIDASNTANLRAILGVAFHEIPFSSMSPQEFSIICNNYSGLLSAQESMDILMAIAINESNKKARAAQRLCDLNSMRNLKCKFTKGDPQRRPTPTKKDGIGFSCDKTIKLTGFIMYNRVAESVRVDVYLKGKQIKCKRTIQTLNKKTKVTFNAPIRVKPNEECRIFVQAIKTRTIGWYGFSGLSKTIKKGVTFRFQRDNCDGIYSITHLLFDIIDEDLLFDIINENSK